MFSRLRNTEQFRKIPRNKLNCMVNYYGSPTWFVTLSPAEGLWPELIQYLRNLNKPKMDNLPPAQLIAVDPVAVSRFIDKKFHAMLDFNGSSDNSIGKITYFFWHREY